MENTDVKEVTESEVTEGTNEIVQEPEDQTEGTTQVKAGDKTEPNLLLSSLQEERQKRRELEARLKELETQSDSETFSDEGRLLKQQIDTLKGQIDTLQNAKTIEVLQAKYPAIKDKLDEFLEFKKDFPEGKEELAAKSFLIEKDLLEVKPRKGLERNSGGGKNIPQQGMNVDEIDTLRKTNYRKYAEMIKTGQIKV